MFYVVHVFLLFVALLLNCTLIIIHRYRCPVGVDIITYLNVLTVCAYMHVYIYILN